MGKKGERNICIYITTILPLILLSYLWLALTISKCFKELHYHSRSNNHIIKFPFHYTNYNIKEVKGELVLTKFDFQVFIILRILLILFIMFAVDVTSARIYNIALKYLLRSIFKYGFVVIKITIYLVYTAAVTLYTLIQHKIQYNI